MIQKCGKVKKNYCTKLNSENYIQQVKFSFYLVFGSRKNNRAVVIVIVVKS